MKTHASRRMCSIILAAALCLAAAHIAYAQDQAGGAVDFSKSKAFKKLDADTQQAWIDATQAKAPDRRFDCFVRVRAPADRGDESFLISAGFVVRMFAGTIASGYMAAKDLPRVALLPFVDAIRLSKTPDPNVQKADRPAAKTP